MTLGKIASHSAAEAHHAALRRLALNPHDSAAWDEVGQAYAAAASQATAQAAFAEAFHLAPDHLGIAERLANAAIASGRTEHELARWSVDEPARPAVLLVRATLLASLGRVADALAVAANFVRVAPTGSVGLRHLLGRLLLRQGRPAEARHHLRLAAASEDATGAMFADVALSELRLGAQAEAAAACRQAIVREPGNAIYHQLLCTCLAYLDGVSGAILTMALREAAALWPRDGARPVRAPRTRLRLGLLGGAFWRHPTTWLTLRGMEHLDPAKFEIHCFVPGGPTDGFTRRWQALASGWHPIGGLDHAEIAASIRRTGIDILIDTGGMLNIGHLPVLALQPAAMLVKWVGAQFHTTGMTETDWLVTDRYETPANLAGLYTERLMKLPGSYICYDPPTDLPPVTTLPARRTGHVTFGSFNSLMKITPACLDCWSAVLHAVPGSRMRMQAPQFDEESVAGSMLKAFAGRGIEAARINLVGEAEHRAMLDAYGEVDIALQTFPYGGGVTLLEGLTMGVPSVTLAGESFASRHGASHLSHAGLAHYIATSPAEYVTIASAIAADLPALAKLRTHLRDHLLGSNICNGPAFGIAFGTALTDAWASTKTTADSATQGRPT